MLRKTWLRIRAVVFALLAIAFGAASVIFIESNSGDYTKHALFCGLASVYFIFKVAESLHYNHREALASSHKRIADTLTTTAQDKLGGK